MSLLHLSPPEGYCDLLLILTLTEIYFPAYVSGNEEAAFVFQVIELQQEIQALKAAARERPRTSRWVWPWPLTKLLRFEEQLDDHDHAGENANVLPVCEDLKIPQVLDVELCFYFISHFD